MAETIYLFLKSSYNLTQPTIELKIIIHLKKFV